MLTHDYLYNVMYFTKQSWLCIFGLSSYDVFNLLSYFDMYMHGMINILFLMYVRVHPSVQSFLIFVQFDIILRSENFPEYIVPIPVSQRKTVQESNYLPDLTGNKYTRMGESWEIWVYEESWCILVSLKKY